MAKFAMNIRRKRMMNAEWILKTTKILLLTILIVLVANTQTVILKKLDKLIELNTPECINVVPDKPLMEEK